MKRLPRWPVYVPFLTATLAPNALAGVTVVTQGDVEYVKEWEKPDDHEQEVISGMVKALVGSVDAAAKASGGRTLRDAHPKAHGCVVADVTVNPDLAPDLQTPVLQPGKSYKAIIRFSSAAPSPAPDSNGDARGMAIKLIGVDGPKLGPGPVDAVTQDFVMINFPIFPAANAAEFAAFAQAIGTGNLPAFFFPSLDPASWRVKIASTLVGFNGKSDASVLQQRFFSQTPALLNDAPIKYSAEPCSNDAAVRPQAPATNFLRQELAGFLAKAPGCFDLEIQRYKSDFEVENGLGWWPAGLNNEEQEPVGLLTSISGTKAAPSPFIKVAHIVIPPQVFDTDAKNIYCDNLSFSTWHSVAAHRPLGSVNRARRQIYQAVSDHRHQANGVAPAEPTSVAPYQALN